MIEVRDLRVEREGRSICDVAALDVAPGERVVIHGPNGCGKTTLLRVLAGLESRRAGRVVVGVPVRERVLVHQDPVMFSDTVVNNVSYGLRARGGPDGPERVRAIMERLDVAHLAARAARTLSAGERRRVSLARAMVLGPGLLLLDEPFDELDADGIRRTEGVLRELADTTVVMASPEPLEIEARLVPISAPVR